MKKGERSLKKKWVLQRDGGTRLVMVRLKSTLFFSTTPFRHRSVLKFQPWRRFLLTLAMAKNTLSLLDSTFDRVFLLLPLRMQAKKNPPNLRGFILDLRVWEQAEERGKLGEKVS